VTRFLSESLQAPEPFFRLGLRQLEAANGHPGTDIRFTADVLYARHDKLRQLGLDPQDTTAAELYKALQERVRQDDYNLTRCLRTLAAQYVSAEADVVAGMTHMLKTLPDSKRAFALKPSSLKSLLKRVPPKRAMKQLGYRSLDSFLKHEPPVSALAAAWLSDGEAWQKRYLDQYKKLTPRDFEARAISITQPTGKRWQQLAARVVTDHHHNLLSFKEIGALVFLPLPADLPAGAVTMSFSLALHELNEIRAASAFLKLTQVRPDFGVLVRQVTIEEPRLSSRILDRPVPWHLIQRYYSRLQHRFREEIFEPYLQREDMVWHPIEHTLSQIEPSFNFWHQSGHLGLLQGKQLVSLNLLDVALNYCNQLPFEHQVAHYCRHSLWHELLLRYLRHEPIEQSVLTELQPAAETVLA